MPTHSRQYSWLILERASRSLDWGMNNPEGKLLFSGFTDTIESSRGKGSPSKRPIIGLVFLPSPTNGAAASSFFEAVTQLFGNNSGRVRVWFHYGGNVTISETRNYWSKWKY